VYDRTGALVEVPPNTLGVTYDPSDLSKAPYALTEPEATNRIRNNTMQGAAVGAPGAMPTNWMTYSTLGLSMSVVGTGIESGIDYIDIQISGTTAGAWAVAHTFFESIGTPAATTGEVWALSLFAKVVAGSIDGLDIQLNPEEKTAAGTTWVRDNFSGPLVLSDAGPLSQNHIFHIATLDGGASTGSIRPYLYCTAGPAAGKVVDVTIRVGLPKLERDRITSPIKTSNGAVTRAADVIGAGAGLVYSNAPIVEPAYDAKATYAKDAKVHDPASYEVFQSLIAGNVGKALTDTGAWSPRGIVNRRAMFDDYNNTQTIMPDEILVVLTPEMVAQGLYLGNLDVHELTLSMVDALDGVVYSEVISLIESNSQSSYFNWMFKRIKRKTYFFVLDMPVYANALVTICLRKIGAQAKAGMCAIGPVEEFGPSLLGLSTEGKDFSSTTFNFDGTSKTTLRPYAKRMSCDVVVPNDEITYVQDRLFELRQRPLVWVGGPYGATAVFGRYGSFKNVIEYQMQSKMNLVIEGAV